MGTDRSTGTSAHVYSLTRMLIRGRCQNAAEAAETNSPRHPQSGVPVQARMSHRTTQ